MARPSSITEFFVVENNDANTANTTAHTSVHTRPCFSRLESLASLLVNFWYRSATVDVDNAFNADANAPIVDASTPAINRPDTPTGRSAMMNLENTSSADW